MALANEIIGSSFLHKTSLVSQSQLFQSGGLEKQFFKPIWVVPVEKRKVVAQLRKAVNSPVAAISEDLVKAVPLADKPVKNKVRAVVTIRNKNKEDIKETIVKQLDAFTDRIGQNVVLQLISTEIDPSESFFPSFSCFFFFSFQFLDVLYSSFPLLGFFLFSRFRCSFFVRKPFVFFPD